MKIVELDGYAANPGDISWQQWENIVAPDGTTCEFVVYDRTPANLVVERAKDADIAITNKVVFSDEVMAQLAIAHLLHITNNIAAHDAAVHQGQWSSCPDFSFTVSQQLELDGKTFAVIGLGNTGMATARIAHALGMKVLAYTSKEQSMLPTHIKKANSLDSLFAEADVLSLHCPLTTDTHHIVNAKRLALMKPTAIIINTGRGPLIDE